MKRTRREFLAAAISAPLSPILLGVQYLTANATNPGHEASTRGLNR
jgi:hypothetical protein